MKLARPLPLVCVCLLAATGGCKTEPPEQLFDEDGVWSLVRYDIGLGFEDVPPQQRGDAFLLKFTAERRVAETAACVSATQASPADSPCLIDSANTFWRCSCYSYAFVKDQMQWREFKAGAEPPEVEFDPENLGADAGDDGGAMSTGATGSDGGGGGESGASSGRDTLIQLSAVTERADTYDFRPLPAGIFASDGVTSHFVFETRARSKFDPVRDDPQGACEPCVPD